MVLIISSDEDQTTSDVIDWLNYFNISFFRINDSSIVKILDINFCDNKLMSFTLGVRNGVNNKESIVSSDVIKMYWYRRGKINLELYTVQKQSNDIFERRLIEAMNRKFILSEYNAIIDFFNLYFKDIPHVGSYFHNHTNKLYNLKAAKEAGLKIPSFLVTNSLNKLKEFLKKEKCIITKALNHGGFTFNKEIGIGAYTSKVTIDDLLNAPKQFGYSLFQKYIDKAYDIRVFVINDKIYSGAILSQFNKQTEIDFRNYDDNTPNRIIPFSLPYDIKAKIASLMDKLSMKSGSIDIVIDKEKRDFYFLEINPIGQFGFLSKRCNYYLEKVVAQELNKR